MEWKYLKTEMQVLYMTVNCKLYNILLSFSSSQSVYCYAFRPRSRERLLVMNIWFHNKKMISFFCYNVLVLA